MRQRTQERNYVAPYAPGEESRAIVPRRVDVLPPERMEVYTPVPVQQNVRLVTSHADRAKGFTIVSLPLAAGVGVGGLLLAIGLFKVPVLSMGALLVLFLAFLGTWLGAWVWHQSASPDGVALWTVLLHFRLLREEQKARLRRMDGEE